MGNQRIAIIGAGSWGTALAIQLARGGQSATIWGRKTDVLTQMDRDRENGEYLPGAPFPDTLQMEPSLETAVRECDDILLVVPSHAFREMLQAVNPMLRDGQRLAWASKGFEHPSGKLLHDVAREIIGAGRPTAVLSGPTFAKEVGRGLPTAITVASANPAFANDLAVRLSDQSFRAYTTTDMIGVEVGGAVKNVLAIGAGASDGLGFGSNTRVALITRGLAEMTRLGVALGAQPETFMGLAGMGDLVLTCTDDQSRNRRFGLAMAAGKSVGEAQEEIRQVVEGVQAARAVYHVARELNIEMPICTSIYKVVYEGLSPRDAVQQLMRRSLKTEEV